MVAQTMMPQTAQGGIAALMQRPMPQMMPQMAPQMMPQLPPQAMGMPYGAAPVMGMQAGGPVRAPAQAARPDPMGLAAAMRSGSMDQRMAALQQMRGMTGGTGPMDFRSFLAARSGKGQGRQDPEQQMSQSLGRFDPMGMAMRAAAGRQTER
jgi:hypothetical protein